MAFKPKPKAAAGKKPPLGTGARFAALKNKLGAQPGVTDPAALAANIGAKKFGQKKMTSMAVKGKKK